MAVQARYTAPVQVVETEAMRARVKKIADAEGISQAQVLRDMHEHSIGWREQRHAEIMAGRPQQ